PLGAELLLEAPAELEGALRATGYVVADVGLDGRLSLEREPVIEGRDREDLRRRHLEAPRDVAQGLLGEPPHPRLEGVEDREEEVPPLAGGVPALGDVPRRRSQAARAEHLVDGRALLGGRFLG